MRGTVPMGRVAGVRIGLHWSVLGIVVLVAAGLAGYQLPLAFPGHSALGYALAGLVAAVLLVGSVLVHELAHAIVARRNGVVVEGITLWLLGGIARLRDEARSPGADLRISIVGPAISAVAGAAFGVLAWGAARVGASGLVVGVLTYLAVLNLVLAVFNLVPAAPLDGGRVLRAALWRWRGDRFEAAAWSARAGLGLGGLLVAAGFAQSILQGPEGMWWILLGLFIASIALAEERQARAGMALSGVRMRDVMSHPVETVDGRSTTGEFLGRRPAHASFPVVRADGGVDGLVFLRRIYSLTARGQPPATLRDAACPMDRVPTAAPDEPLAAVLPRLSESTDGHVLVFDDGRLVGIVAPSDIDRAVAARGVHVILPALVEREANRQAPPPNWWYPGRPR
ncbi:Zn-dependent protease (includes SpoIVFB) [Saccharopolyspora shandongensis]|uniref:Zinc metalloprotease n=2 Tax=Saccharopolyspora shandongensis TaxID=418495 RepID=A0A1H2ZES3_9PSEU|nr:site-2 protease family protein [Saccharopolyspora shandongensis]SDX15993.1 Zn-dependent protease (includes SpoIVFB) [Saccharopolyspora shandongensis]